MHERSRQTGPVPVHWSKDFVEHLRTVHFTLILSCVGLILLAFFPSKSDISAAHGQLVEIQTVTNSWNDKYLESAGDDLVKKAALGGFSRLFLTERPNIDPSDSLPAAFEVHLQLISRVKKETVIQWGNPRLARRLWFIQTAIPTELLPDQSPVQIEFRVNAPPSVKSFQLLWDSSLQKSSVIVPVSNQPPNLLCSFRGELPLIYSQDGYHVDLCMARPIFSTPLLKNLFGSRQILRFRRTTGGAGDGFELFLPNGISSDDYVIPIDVQRLDLDAHGALVRTSDKWKSKYKVPFKDAFRELAAVDGPFEDSNIASAERILAAEMQREGEVFEAAGLKIPAEIAVKFGVLLVLGVQLYMWIHLHEFGNRVERDAGFDVAWIGVYFSRPARAIFLASLFVLPLATTIVLSYKGIHLISDQWTARIIVVFANAANLSLSYLILRVLPKQNLASPAEANTLDQTKGDSSA